MALVRNIAGVHKLGLTDLANPEESRIILDDVYGTDNTYQPMGFNPNKWAVPDGGYDPNKWAVPVDVVNPDGAYKPDVGDVQPVYPIEPIRGHEEQPPSPEVPVNTVQVTQPEGQVDIIAIGALASIIGMALGLRPKGVFGGIVYAGACGLLWMRLHYQTTGLETDPGKA
jgi:hypothetical protein